MRILLILFFNFFTLSCQSEIERLEGETIFHLKNAISILEKYPFDMEKATYALNEYIKDNKKRIIEIKLRGKKILNEMNLEQRERFQKNSEKRIKPLIERIENLARSFPDPKRILLLVRQLM